MTGYLHLLRSLVPARRAALLAQLALALLLLAATVNGVLFALTRYPEFVAQFPGAIGWRFVAQLLVAKLGIVSLIGIVFLRQWALWLYLLASVLTVMASLLTRAPLHYFIAVTASSLAVLALGYVNRSCFAD